MKSKYRFGLTEVIAMIVGSLIIVVLDLTFRQNNFYHADTIKSALVVILAAVFGSPTGVVVAVASSLLLAAILKLDVSLIVVMAYIIIALLVGHYSSTVGIRDGLFKGRSIVIFVFAKLMAEIFAWLFFWPLVSFLITKENLFEILNQKMRMVLMLTFFDVFIVPAFILVSRFMSKRIDKDGLQ